MRERVGEYIRSNLPKDQYPGEQNEFVVKQYLKSGCTFDQVLLRYHYLLATQSLSPMPGMEAEDLYQELVMKLLKCCTKWDPDKDLNFSTYLVNACINHIRYILRKQLNSNRKFNFVGIISLEQPISDEDGSTVHINEPSEDFILPDRLVIEGLPITSREKQYILPLLEGRSLGEIADKLKVSRTRVTQVLRGLGRKLVEMGIELF